MGGYKDVEQVNYGVAEGIKINGAKHGKCLKSESQSNCVAFGRWRKTTREKGEESHFPD